MRRRTFVYGLGAAGGFALAGGRLARVDAAQAAALVRVRIFAADDIRSAVLSALSSSVRLDETSAPTAMSAAGTPITVSVTGADGQVTIRRYAGEIRSSNVGGRLVLINAVDLESYVASVMASEISAGWRPETLKAQAIAVRTYALRRMRHAKPAAYDLVDDTTNQVYRGIDRIVPSLSAAAAATAGQALFFGGDPADVWYHSACGGHTAGSNEVTGEAAAPYLRGVADLDARGLAYCAPSAYYSWRNTLAADSIARIAGITGDAVASAVVVERWGDGRARTVRVQTAGGATTDMDAHRFYARAGAVLGYKVVPSTFFDLAPAGADGFSISGHGIGHGVGMCQWGAEGRARAGLDAAAILTAYFPGTSFA